jgi:hypothetical protein
MAAAKYDPGYIDARNFARVKIWSAGMMLRLSVAIASGEPQKRTPP